MITSDIDVKKIISDRLEEETSEIEKDILSVVNILLEQYSFVQNQTYPRPGHPDISKRKDAYFTLIAIVLSLRTTLENEIKAVNNFCDKYTNITEVANADIDELSEVIKCAGMPKKKALTIINISKYIIENYDGDINNINDGNIDNIREKLFKLPGLGEKSVDCMLELAFDLPSIVVDVNVFRTISRLYFSDNIMSFNNKSDILKIKNFIEENIEKDYKIYQIIHTIILLHGKHICKSNPNCEKCVLCNHCTYFKKSNCYNQLKLF